MFHDRLGLAVLLQELVGVQDHLEQAAQLDQVEVAVDLMEALAVAEDLQGVPEEVVLVEVALEAEDVNLN